MKRPIRPEWLLRQARELAGTSVGQPRHVDLRRATSAAYYALFHELASAVVSHLLPGSTGPEWLDATRKVSHSSLSDASDWISGSTPPKHLGAVVERLRSNGDLTDLAQAFKELQEARELADYDHTADLTRPGTVARIRQADGAVRLVSQHSNDDDFRSFLGLVALKVRP